MAEQKSDSLKMIATGMVLGLVNDIRPKGKFNFLQNIRVYTEGVLESRPPIDTYITLGAGSDILKVPHTIKTIIDKATGNFNRIVGQGTKIFTGDGLVLDEKDSGYSGSPLFMVDFRPEQSVEAYVYIADENKFRKISVSNLISDVGIDAPAKSAVWAIGRRAEKIIDKIDAGSEGQWNNLQGSATAPTLEERVNTTVQNFFTDGPLPNFATIVPTVFPTALLKDSIVAINGNDYIVSELVPSPLNPGLATISKISYDNNVGPGLATIVLSVSSPDIKRNSILLINAIEYVRVLDVNRDSNGVPSIRTETVGVLTPGMSISGVNGFRIFTEIAYAGGETITNNSIKTNVSAAGLSSIERIFNIDLLNTGVDGKPLTFDDHFYIALLIGDPTQLTELQVQLIIDDNNYFYYPIAPNLFTASVAQTLPTTDVLLQAIQQRDLFSRIIRLPDPTNSGQYYDLPIPDEGITFPVFDSTQTTLGRQWTQAQINLRDFIRVGSDGSKGLRNITAIKVSVNTTGPTDLFVDSIWVGGSDALENTIQGLMPYNYVWRVRDPKTRARSNWSPPLRSGIKISRGKVVLTFPDANANYPVDYKIDVARFGGALTDFRIVGSINNDGSEFTDSSSDRVVADNERAGRSINPGDENQVFDFYKPFAILDTPKNGTVDVVGSKLIWKTGDKWKTSYPRGTQIIINGIANRFFAPPSDEETAELERDMGSLSDVVYEIQDALMVGQPLPVVFGPFGEGNFGLYIFGLGDKNAAGTLYWLDGNSPDTMSNLNRLEITAPSEPLITGVMWDNYGYVYTRKRSFQLIPTVSATGAFGFVARKNSTSRGAYSQHTIVAAPDGIYSLSGNADGLYRVQGVGNPECITDGAIGNLFYRNNKKPQPIELIDGTVIYPPDFSKIDELRLYSIEDFVMFKFLDTDPIESKQVVLVYDCKLKDFISYDIYPAGDIDVFYLEDKEGEPSVLVGIAAGVARIVEESVLEADVKSKVIPFALDGGDSRFNKEFTEEVTSFSGELTLTNYYNNGDIIQAPVNLVSIEREQIITDLPQETVAKNITPVFEWEINSKTKLYEEIIYFLLRGDEVKDRASDLEFGEGIGAKLWQGVIIQADTNGEDKELEYYDDRNVLRATIIINHNGRQTKEYSFAQPFISHTIRRKSSDEIEWTPIVESYIYDVEPESAEVWEGEFNTSDLTGLILIKRMAIAYRSDVDAEIKLIFDDETEQSYLLPNSINKWKKHFFFVQAKKWKACKYRIEATGGTIRPYKRACEVWAKSFNGQNDFVRLTPFGGDSNVTDVKI